MCKCSPKAEEEGIQGLIFKRNKVWVAIFATNDGYNKTCDSQIDYCPWCGEKLQNGRVDV